MAVLGNRGTGVLDMLIEGFRNQGQEVVTPVNMSPVTQARTPLQQAMNRPEVMLSQPTGRNMVTFDNGRMIEASTTPNVQRAIGQAAQPMSIDQARASEGFNRIAQYQAPSAQPQTNVPVNRLIGGQKPAMGQGVMQPGMDREKMMRDAKVAKDVLDTGDESLIERAKSYFGSRENMLNLAMAFNTMRLEPDAQLTAALSKRLETIDKNKVSQMSQGQIVNYLQQNGYPELAQVAAQNPNIAKTIMEQVLQKELKPAGTRKAFEPLKDPTTGQYSIPVYDPETNTTTLVEIEGAVGETPAQIAERETQEQRRDKGIQKAADRASKVFDQAQNTSGTIRMLYEALETAKDPDTLVGPGWSMLPAFTASTSAIRELQSRLGIGIINSVTFGALSESELNLALNTALNIGLDRPELIKDIERRIATAEKLYEAMLMDAELLASGITENEYVKILNDRRKRNKAITGSLKELQKVMNYSKDAWRQLSPDDQLKLLESKGIVVEFVE